MLWALRSNLWHGIDQSKMGPTDNNEIDEGCTAMYIQTLALPLPKQRSQELSWVAWFLYLKDNDKRWDLKYTSPLKFFGRVKFAYCSRTKTPFSEQIRAQKSIFLLYTPSCRGLVITSNCYSATRVRNKLVLQVHALSIHSRWTVEVTLL